jgi:hypothetical protein
LARTEASVAFRTCKGSRRRSLPLSSSRTEIRSHHPARSAAGRRTAGHRRHRQPPPPQQGTSAPAVPPQPPQSAETAPTSHARWAISWIPAGSRRTISRKPSCLISCTQPAPLGGRSVREGQARLNKRRHTHVGVLGRRPTLSSRRAPKSRARRLVAASAAELPYRSRCRSMGST